MTPVLLLLLATSQCGWFFLSVCVCVYVLEVGFYGASALDPFHSLVPLPLLLSFFSSFPLPLLFPVSTSGTPTELPGSSDSEEVLPGINTHTYTNFLVRFTPLSSVLPQTSCLSPAAPQLPQMNTSQRGIGVNTRAVCDKKAAQKHKEPL